MSTITQHVGKYMYCIDTHTYTGIVSTLIGFNERVQAVKHTEQAGLEGGTGGSFGDRSLNVKALLCAA